MIKLISLSAATCLLSTWGGEAAAIGWPQEIDAPEGTIVVYQPQPERLDGNTLSGRAAMSLEIDGRDPIFGAFWFEASIDTDTDSGTAWIRNVDVTEVRWPDSTDASEQRFTAVVEGAVPESGFEISLDRLSASLETAEVVQQSLADLNTDPPAIIFRDTLAVLLVYDGAPRFVAIENSAYERALNTPFAVVRDSRGGAVFLASGAYWYTAADPLGPWTPTENPPADLLAMMPEPGDDVSAPDTPPAIVAATEPTELIVTVGPPAFQSLPGAEILYVGNTETPWLRDLSSNQMYVLLSGRWYRSQSQSGPWTFVRADELPASFADIPPASDIGGVRVSVTGTEEAEDAMLDAQIPQTAAIQRDQAMLEVEYDGEPRFEQIPGTSVSYAANTGAQVLSVAGRYYAVDDGVWFTASAPSGPWVVADSVPEDEIRKIPPSSPVYNTTHVHVYDSTPDVVYVGYTPGYLWSFPYYGVPVYGTGWYYPPHWGRWYYPRPPTWGLHVGYNPWTGWNFGVSWSNGFFTFAMSWGGGWDGSYYRPWGCCGGWYGGGYRPPVVINTGDINIGNSINIGNRTNIANRIGSNDIDIDRSRSNVYNRTENRARNAASATSIQGLREARPATNRANDVFADANGNVARRVGDQWESRQSGQWSRDASIADRAAPQARNRPRSPASTTRATLPSTRQFDRSSLDTAFQSRQRGMSREATRMPSGAPDARPSLRR
jgi:hypothetical protein